MGFIKTCDQSHKFNFGHFFSFLGVISLCLSGGDKNLEESFALEAWAKMTRIIFWFANAFSSNLENASHVGAYTFTRKFNKCSGEMKP